MRHQILFLLLIICSLSVFCQQDVTVGAARTDLYINNCLDKNVAIVSNHTSLVDTVHLVDFLLDHKVDIKCIFCPEHGFRGNAGAGELIENGKDPKTGIPIISLYGNHKKPTKDDLIGIDLVIFDLQDVGVRFYTYISTLAYVMDACAHYNIPVIVLDRPNPNGYYVDGPVLKSGFESFVGLYTIPIVYGMTIGEFALMVNGEQWLDNKLNCSLTVIPLDNYSHNTVYYLPVAPSPNLQTMNAIWLYPTTCLFEGTIVSVGRGTHNPFELICHPDILHGDTIITPVSIKGVANNPKFINVECKGYSLLNEGNLLRYSTNPCIDIELIIRLFDELGKNADFFTNYFDKLAGNDVLRQQIIDGVPADQIRDSWQDDLDTFNKIRNKYLIYK